MLISFDQKQGIIIYLLFLSFFRLDRQFLINICLFSVLVCIFPLRCCLMCNFSFHYPDKMSLIGVITDFIKIFSLSPVTFRFYLVDGTQFAGWISPLGDCTVQNPSISPEGSWHLFNNLNWSEPCTNSGCVFIHSFIQNWGERYPSPLFWYMRISLLSVSLCLHLNSVNVI